VGLPVSQHIVFDVRKRRLRRDTATTAGGAVESGSGVHLRAPRVRLSHGPPLLSRSTRGRNSPRRRSPRYHPACPPPSGEGHSFDGCHGPHPSGSTEALPTRPFFRRLPGDGRIHTTMTPA